MTVYSQEVGPELIQFIHAGDLYDQPWTVAHEKGDPPVPNAATQEAPHQARALARAQAVT